MNGEKEKRGRQAKKKGKMSEEREDVGSEGYLSRKVQISGKCPTAGQGPTNVDTDQQH
jgi:hypothetical protein